MREWPLHAAVVFCVRFITRLRRGYYFAPRGCHGNIPKCDWAICQYEEDDEKLRDDESGAYWMSVLRYCDKPPGSYEVGSFKKRIPRSLSKCSQFVGFSEWLGRC
ncbi:hypothetical protein TNCV_182381 [Trichonephila clavipes]|nr:hypothetical protein TNCV_182381 [Trichonephila clavipes]